MGDKPRIITGGALLKALAPVVGFDVSVIRRIVLDVRLDDVIVVYVELLGDSRLVEINWPGELKEANIVMVEKAKQ